MVCPFFYREVGLDPTPGTGNRLILERSIARVQIHPWRRPALATDRPVGSKLREPIYLSPITTTLRLKASNSGPQSI